MQGFIKRFYKKELHKDTFYIKFYCIFKIKCENIMIIL